tara:strand:+ start:586 stop:1692 length:1107 start_codon:yes stop_codon:yes gene_type:complete
MANDKADTRRAGDGIFQKTAIALLLAGVLSVSALGLTDLLSGARDSAPYAAGSTAAAAAEPVAPTATAVSRVQRLFHARSGGGRGAAPIAELARLAKPERVLTVSSTGKLSDLFDRIGYRLDGVRADGNVPRLLIGALPKDLSLLRQSGERKLVFIKSTLPIILHVNEQVLKQRDRIVSLREKVDAGGTLSADERAWLNWIADRYGLEGRDFDALLERVDVIPPSLAIAQAAEESGWGTSRFAREGNALFGQRVYREDLDGLVPEERGEDEVFRVRAFNHLIDGVRAYVHNLNSHFAYEGFRARRAELRAAEQAIDGKELIEMLDRYSERGEAYVETIRTIMRVNRLGVFDRARLHEGTDQAEVVPDA